MPRVPETFQYLVMSPQVGVSSAEPTKTKLHHRKFCNVRFPQFCGYQESFGMGVAMSWLQSAATLLHITNVPCYAKFTSDIF